MNYVTITKAIDDLVDNLHGKLSQDHVMLDVDYGKKKFNFHKPLDAKGKSDQYRQRKMFVKLIVGEALSTYIKNIDDEDADLMAFNRINELMAMIPSKEQIQSPIAPESYEEIKVEAKKSVGLNYDAYQVKMQDERNFIDEYPDLITHNCGCGIRDTTSCC